MKKELNQTETSKVFGGIEVKIGENEPLDVALRKFKKACAKAGILQELRKKEHYENPSIKRKKKSEAARRRKY